MQNVRRTSIPLNSVLLVKARIPAINQCMSQKRGFIAKRVDGSNDEINPKANSTVFLVGGEGGGVMRPPWGEARLASGSDGG